MNAHHHRRRTLAGSVIGAVIVALDGTVLTVAQPSIQRDLHASFAQVQWAGTGYLIAVASLLVLAGRLGDRYGHQRLFALGMLGFGATSAGIGLAPGISWVIGLRVAQGVFGALLQPATLGMLRAAYPPDRLQMPLALRTSAIGVAAAAGPVVGGALTTHLGWRSVFFLNVVPALLTGVAALLLRAPTVAAAGKASGTRLDLPGACLLAVAAAALVHTLVGIPEAGWTTATALGLATAAAAGGWFVRHMRLSASPLVPPSVLRSAPVASALGILLSASASLFGTLFIGTYFLQDVLALDALQSGLRVLPLAVMMVLSAPAGAILQRRYGTRRTALAGMSLLALGILLFSRLGPESTAAAVGGCFLAMGAGFGTVMVTATAVIVQGVPAEHSGVAGGLQQTAMNIGPAVGVAVATMLMTATTGPAGASRSAMHATLLPLTAVAVVGALLSLPLPGRAHDRRPRVRRRIPGVRRLRPAPDGRVEEP